MPAEVDALKLEELEDICGGVGESEGEVLLNSEHLAVYRQIGGSEDAIRETGAGAAMVQCSALRDAVNGSQATTEDSDEPVAPKRRRRRG